MALPWICWRLAFASDDRALSPGCCAAAAVWLAL
jgi:hypothetical protein